MTDSVGAELLAPLAGSSVLVTGGAGFVGSRLAGALAEVCDVTVLDDLTTGTLAAVPDRAKLVRGDVRDVETVVPLVTEADVVFHQAALADVRTSVRSPVETHTRNAGGTVTVLDAARRTDTRVVLASTAAVYGRPDSLPVRESDPKRPTSPYGVAKLAADGYARTYADLYGLETVVLRYFNVYGADRRDGAPDVVSTFAERARAGEPLVVHGDGSQTRDFVHVDDVVQANVRAATTDDTGRAFNVGTGERTSIRSVAQRVRRATNATSDLVYGEARPGDVDHSCAAIDRARESLGYEPTVGIDAGLRSVVRGSAPADWHAVD